MPNAVSRTSQIGRMYGCQRRTISLGMSAADGPGQPSRRSACTLVAPSMTVNPRTRPTHRARRPLRPEAKQAQVRGDAERAIVSSQ